MELIKVLQSFGLTVENIDEMSDEQLQEMIDKHVNEKEEHIKTLEADKESLSKSNEELTASVEGEKAVKEKLDKELSEAKTKLATTEGKLSQLTDMYKEQFTKPANEQDKPNKKLEHVKADVLDLLLDTK